MNNDKPLNGSNVIPLVDVTAEVSPTEAEAKALGREGVLTILDRGDSYMMLSLGTDPQNPITDVVCACTDDQIPPMVITAVTMLGLSLLGSEKVAVLPPEMMQGLALTVGLKKLHDMVRSAHERQLAMAEPQTPAGDVGEPPVQH